MTEIVTTMTLDDMFEADFTAVFGGKKQYIEYLSEYVSSTLIDEDSNIDYLKLINTLKTTHVIGESYTFFKKKAYDYVKQFDGRDRFILSLVIISLDNIGVIAVNKYLTTKKDALLDAVERSYAHAGFSTHDGSVMKAPDALAFTDKVGDTVNSWDEYYYNICKQVARNSKCFSRQIGAILVRDKSIISTGYNGPPRGVPTCDKRWKNDQDFITKYGKHSVGKDVEGKCPRYVIGFKSGTGLEICPAGHAERNSLINACRLGTATKGAIMYMTCGIPCTPCLVEIINAGISEIILTSLIFYDETAKYLLENSELLVRVYDFVLTA